MTTLLLIDKEVNKQLLYKDEFQGEGYEVTVAETIEEALEKIDQSKPDIITLGIKILGTKDIEFLRKIKDEERDIPVVLCSAHEGSRQALHIRLCDAFVVQSADLTELKGMIKLILNQKNNRLFLN